jgi:hydrogenase maturation protein HypF
MQQAPHSVYEQYALWSVRVTGTVQGVGFRPFIYKLAADHGLFGWVFNDPNGVFLQVQCDEARLRDFVSDVYSRRPVLSKIDEIVTNLISIHAEPIFNSFEIRESNASGEKLVTIPPDYAVCDDCARELKDPADRRYRYPFINCTNCGPRYSIINGIPYDRKYTSMACFPMCKECNDEYKNPLDRRYHAQPNACPVCGPSLSIFDRYGIAVATDDCVTYAVEALLQGKIVAIKSVGGFHFAVNAHDPEAVALLRQRKKRDSKPFALMVESVEKARQYATVEDREAEILESPERPIVLLRKRPDSLPEAIAPRNPNYGVMLPSAPLHNLFFMDPRLQVLVMTSGNISGYPIVFKNDQALEQLPEVADLILLNNRDIETRVDDSIIRCSSHPELEKGVITFIRRARGYAPYPVTAREALTSIVAYGAELKTTVALSEGKRIFVSQHIGDLKNPETFASHQRCADHLKQLYDITPEAVACDLHPAFTSTRSALELNRGSVYPVQHHHAHMASCMGEHGLTGSAIGIVFDGTGFGSDGTIWGGEFLVGDLISVHRAAHLRPFPLLGGDRAVKEPVRVALSLLHDAFDGIPANVRELPVLRELSDEVVAVYSRMHRNRINSPLTSSMGRLFDGISALLDLCSIVEYEAQAAIEMESLLERDHTMAEPFRYDLIQEEDRLVIDWRPMVREVVYVISEGIAAALISRRFHSTVVSLMVEVCGRLARQTAISQVVLSGGVFLNEFVLVNALTLLRSKGLTPYCNEFVPTNDGGVSLGQIMVANAQHKLKA